MSLPPQELAERLAKRCLELVAIPSVTGNEKAIADYIEAWARRLKAIDNDDIVRHSNSLIVGTPDDSRPCIALVGHTDTVPGHPDDPPPGRQGDRITGLGASDMKGALAVMMLLAETLNLESLPFSLVLVFYEKEEGPYADNGLQPLLDDYEILQHVDLAIAMEPTDNTLQLGCMGGLQAKVTFHGKASHSARPWQGENAIHKAGAFLQAMHGRPINDVHVQGLLFREAMSVTLAQGGRARNTIPERFDLNVNYRFAPIAPIDASVANAKAELMRVAAGAEVTIYDVSPPGPVPADNPILEHLRNTGDLKIEPKQAWTDVARLAAYDIDAVNFGPGIGAQAHQQGEWASIDAMVHAFTVLEHTLSLWLESE